MQRDDRIERPARISQVLDICPIPDSPPLYLHPPSQNFHISEGDRSPGFVCTGRSFDLLE